MTEKKQQVLSVNEFHEATNIPKTTIRTWLTAGELMGTKVGRKWVIPISELERLVNPEKSKK
jgi:excisionase family DNA binding protein